ncbi:MAG TPA: sialate O-acetylesterase [Steroidobacteraceae bacterium]|nr:sialate O-acetylesterase [Steroidobacteraceae bacterium]
MNIDWRPVLAMLGVLAAAQVPAADAAAPPLLDSMFQDHAVLQRDRPIPIWGRAHPGDQLAVSINAGTVHARADASGHWRTVLPAMQAGGPYSLEVRAHSGAVQSLSDLLVGDVWLCSGQSNMELPVSRALDAAHEISGSTNNLIRVLTVAHASSPLPLEEFAAPVSWQAAAPATISEFSAVCYYFARELQKSVPVPMGLIHSSFGGSAIEPWLSEAGLRGVGGFDERLDLLRLYARDPDAGNQSLADLWKRWWRTRAPAGSAPWKAVVEDPKDWHDVPEPMRDWKTWGVPELANHDGMVWFRRTFVLTPEQAAQSASLSLGAIDEVDETWVNDRAVGNSFGWGTERTYKLPAGVLHPGENSLVVNVLSTWDAGGMYGPPDHMALRFAQGAPVALGGQWRYQFVPESMGYPPRAPWESIGGLTSLHNAMIAPLEPYGLRGVLWYQGESNAGDPGPYQALLSRLMADWRNKFGAELPFLIVELPNFGLPPAAPAASGWASLREAQRRAAAADSHAALAVTIDAGDRHELHPPNKQEVGRRLARAARHLIYAEPLSASGPVPLSARRDNTRVVVTFNDVDGALVAYSARRPVGFELCGDDQSSCRFVDAAVEANRVLLDAADAPPPTRVRFCWGDAPICNLYDRSGLPAGPFEILIQK